MEERLKRILFFVTPYSLFGGFLYLFGYWGALDINIFEWISFQDIAGYSILPLVVSGLSTVILTILAAFLYPWEQEPVSATVKTPLYYILLFTQPLLVLGGILLLVNRAVKPSMESWFAFGVLTVAYCTAYFGGVLDREIKRPGVRRVAVFVLVAFPIVCLWSGRAQARWLLDGRDYRYIESSQLRSEGIAGPGERLKYLGKAGDYFFLSTMDNRMKIVLKYENFILFSLKDSRAEGKIPSHH